MTTLAVSLAGPLQEHLERVRLQFEEDRRAESGAHGVARPILWRRGKSAARSPLDV